MERNLPISEQTASGKVASKISALAWTIFISGILYYCFAYLLRVYPSVMEPQLLGHFSITAGSFGLLTAVYYFAYAPMQLPVGVSVDKIGPRRSLLLACCVCIIGATLFAKTDNYYVALMGRFLIGFGAAFAYVTALKLATIWLPRHLFATATGVVTGSGMLAAILTDIYLNDVVINHGYHTALTTPIFLGLGLLLIILIVIREKPKKQTSALQTTHALTFRELIEHLLVIIKNPQMWLIGCVGALMYLPSSVFLDVWAIPYFERAYRLSSSDAVFAVSIMLAGWISSSFATGALSDLLGTRRIPILIATFSSAVVATFILYVPNIPELALYVLLFIFGAFCGPHPLCFTLSKENCSTKISGTAIAFANFVIMMGGFIFQPVVGKLLDAVWMGTTENGIRIYTSNNYMSALSIIPVGLLIAGILSLFIKETYRKSVDDKN